MQPLPLRLLRSLKKKPQKEALDLQQIVVYIVPLAHCVFGWRGKTERRAMLSKAFPRMYTENEANARLQPWLPKGTPKL